VSSEGAQLHETVGQFFSLLQHACSSSPKRQY